MKKSLVFLFFVLFLLLCGGLTFAEIKDCRIGTDPENPNLIIGQEETEYALTEPTIVRMKGGSGKEYTCRLAVGEIVVVDNVGKVKRVRNCGNTLLTDLFIKIHKKVEVEPVKKKVEVEAVAEKKCPDVNVYCSSQPATAITTTTTYIPYYDRPSYYGYPTYDPYPVYIGMGYDYYGSRDYGYGYRPSHHSRDRHYRDHHHRDNYRSSPHPSPPPIPRDRGGHPAPPHIPY